MRPPGLPRDRRGRNSPPLPYRPMSGDSFKTLPALSYQNLQKSYNMLESYCKSSLQKAINKSFIITIVPVMSGAARATENKRVVTFCRAAPRVAWCVAVCRGVSRRRSETLETRRPRRAVRAGVGRRFSL